MGRSYNGKDIERYQEMRDAEVTSIERTGKLEVREITADGKPMEVTGTITEVEDYEYSKRGILGVMMMTEESEIDRNMEKGMLLSKTQR